MTSPADRHDAALAAMADEALKRGLTWAQIGSAIGQRDPKAAKARVKKAARSARRAAGRKETAGA